MGIASSRLVAWLAFAFGFVACSANTVSTTRQDAQVVSGDLPCDVERVLVAGCQQCHSSPPRNDAPFPLVTLGDTRRLASDRPIASYMLAAIESGRMPLAPGHLSAEDKDTLVTWLRAGAPAARAPRVCTPATRNASADAGDAGLPDGGAGADGRVARDSGGGSDGGAEGATGEACVDCDGG